MDDDGLLRAARAISSLPQEDRASALRAGSGRRNNRARFRRRRSPSAPRPACSSSARAASSQAALRADGCRRSRRCAGISGLSRKRRRARMAQSSDPVLCRADRTIVSMPASRARTSIAGAVEHRTCGISSGCESTNMNRRRINPAKLDSILCVAIFYFSRAPTGTSSRNPASTGVPFSPSEAATIMPFDSSPRILRGSRLATMHDLAPDERLRRVGLGDARQDLATLGAEVDFQTQKLVGALDVLSATFTWPTRISTLAKSSMVILPVWRCWLAAGRRGAGSSMARRQPASLVLPPDACVPAGVRWFGQQSS